MKLLKKLPNAKRYKDWITLMELVGEYKQHTTTLGRDFHEITREVNKAFQQWMLSQYHSLTSLPPYPNPKLVHHIPHVISREKRTDEKIALIVLDGMSYMEWGLIRNHLKDKKFSFLESGVFAWVPTLTSVSRQAIFSGNPPITFGKYITTTSNEEKWWKAFWEDQGTLKQYVTYQKGLGKKNMIAIR